TIDIDQFVPKAEVDERYLENLYYLAPTDKVGQEPFAVIRDAIRDLDMVALGRVVLSRRERVIMLEPFERGLLGMTLRYPYEVRKEDAYSRISPTSSCRRRGASLPLISSRRSRGISILPNSRIITRRRLSSCCGASRKASASSRSGRRRGRATWST